MKWVARSCASRAARWGGRGAGGRGGSCPRPSGRHARSCHGDGPAVGASTSRITSPPPPFVVASPLLVVGVFASPLWWSRPPRVIPGPAGRIRQRPRGSKRPRGSSRRPLDSRVAGVASTQAVYQRVRARINVTAVALLHRLGQLVQGRAQGRQSCPLAHTRRPGPGQGRAESGRPGQHDCELCRQKWHHRAVGMF
jgi:hypothetical protein